VVGSPPRDHKNTMNDDGYVSADEDTDHDDAIPNETSSSATSNKNGATHHKQAEPVVPLSLSNLDLDAAATAAQQQVTHAAKEVTKVTEKITKKKTLNPLSI
jgi:hypothetical protein